MSLAQRLPPHKGSGWLFEGPASVAFARPWFDQLSSRILEKRLFPLFRLWAAAAIAEQDVDRFCAESRIGPLDRSGRKLALRLMCETTSALKEKDDTDSDWEVLYFGVDRPSPESLVSAEVARRGAAAKFLAKRHKFRPLARGRNFGIVRFEPASMKEMEEFYGDWLADPDSAYPTPDQMPEIEVSHSVLSQTGKCFWLRFLSSGRKIRDTAWAKIIEPVDSKSAPTLIYCHGLGEETELRSRFLDETPALVDMGVRVIRLDAPWHNRRFVAGRWSGEPFLGAAPGGPVYLFEAQLRELAILTKWCRSRFGTPVAIGGLSMGAMTAQLAAYRANAWPLEMQPDALFLAANSEDMWEVCFDGRVGKRAGVADSVRAAGWSDDALGRVRQLTNPIGLPVMPPDRIVVKLGLADDVMPYSSGASLVERWRVPAQNVFERNQGHFTVPMSMVRNPRAFRRLASILHSL